MFIECYNNNGIPYLRLVRSVRRPSKSDPNKITSYKHTELSIGPLSRFDDTAAAVAFTRFPMLY